MQGIHCCVGSFLVVENRGLLSGCGAWAFSLWWLLLLQSTGSAVVVHGLTCPKACEIFPDQGSNGVSSIGRQILYHWVTREAPTLHFKSWKVKRCLFSPSMYILIHHSFNKCVCWLPCTQLAKLENLAQSFLITSSPLSASSKLYTPTTRLDCLFPQFFSTHLCYCTYHIM